MKKKEEAQKQEQEEREKMREEMLTAKVAKTRTSNQTDSQGQRVKVVNCIVMFIILLSAYKNYFKRTDALKNK